MCRSRRALDDDGADTAENEPLEDYRLIIPRLRNFAGGFAKVSLSEAIRFR